MSTNPVIATLGIRLRLAVIGGGPGSFIGGMHRMAARIDDRYELVAGVLSSEQKAPLNGFRSSPKSLALNLLGLRPRQRLPTDRESFHFQPDPVEWQQVILKGFQTGLPISIKMLPKQSLSGLQVKRQIRLPCIFLLLPMVLLEYFLLKL